MKQTIYLIAIMAMCFTNSARASHIVGGHLSYRYIADSVYKIELTLITDCSAAAASASSLSPIMQPAVCFTDNGTYVFSDTLFYDATLSGSEVGIVCPAAISQCQNVSSVIPGSKKNVYSKIIKLPYPSDKWMVTNAGVAVNLVSMGFVSSFTTFNAPGSVMALRAEINSTVPNSSVNFVDTLPTYICLEQLSTYHLSASDTENDSLDFMLTPIELGTPVATSCSTYNATYTAPATYTTPVSATVLSLNATTGDLDVKPDLLQRAGVHCTVREYRGGVFVGSSRYMFSADVAPCSGGNCTLAVSAPGAATSHPLIYPNPATGTLFFNTEATQYTSITLVNPQGQQVLHTNIPAIGGIDVSLLPAGIYYATLHGSNGPRTMVIRLTGE